MADAEAATIVPASTFDLAENDATAAEEEGAKPLIIIPYRGATTPFPTAQGSSSVTNASKDNVILNEKKRKLLDGERTPMIRWKMIMTRMKMTGRTEMTRMKMTRMKMTRTHLPRKPQKSPPLQRVKKLLHAPALGSSNWIGQKKNLLSPTNFFCP
jgi:hypothetical protein